MKKRTSPLGSAIPPMPSLTEEHERLWSRHLNSKSGYQPFLSATDVKRSISNACREMGFKEVRPFHMISKLERDAFLILDSTRRVIRILEQYPIDPQESWQICCVHGLDHSKISGLLTVSSIDFLVSFLENGKVITVGIDVKVSTKLQDENTLRKLEVSQLWCALKGYRHWIWTERDINSTLASNIKEMRDSIDIEKYNISERQIQAVQALLEPRLKEDKPISDMALECDSTCGFKFGHSLRIVQFLIVKGIWQYDLREKFDPSSAVTTQFVTCHEPPIDTKKAA